MDIRWFVYALKMLPLRELNKAAAVPGLNREDAYALLIPLPPLAEQRHIAAILAARMAEVERARAAAGAQLAAARALPAAELRAVFASEEARAWPIVSLGDITEIASGVTLGRKVEGRLTRPIAYLRVANVKDGNLDLSSVYTIEATDDEISKLLLRWGDVLLTEGGDPDKLGQGSYWRDELDECIHQNHIYRVRFDLGRVSPAFVSAQIGSPYGKAYFLRHAKQTTGIATINQQVLRAFPLMLPSLQEQRRIAALLDARMAHIARLRQALEAQRETINALPAALLRQAFGGEL